MWLHNHLACLGVFILMGHRFLALGGSFLAASNSRRVWGAFSSGYRRWSTPSRAPTSFSEQRVGDMISSLACVSWRFHSGRTSMSRVSYQSPMASLEACFWWREDLLPEEPLFLWRKFSELLSGSLDVGVSNEILSSEECSPKDMLLEFGGKSWRSGIIEGSEWDNMYFFSKRCKHTTVMEFCITFIRCNQICIWKNVFGMKRLGINMCIFLC